MRHPSRLRTAALLVALGTLPLAACSGDDAPEAPTTTTSAVASTTSSTVADSAELVPFLITADDLPPGFAPVEDVGDTVTSFCAGEDAAAGLRATGRAIVGFSRTPAGVSVLHVVFRFVEGDAEAFVDQAEAILGRCDEVPDIDGLAFDYAAAPEAITTILAEATDAAASRDGRSVGSGSLRSIVGVFRRGDVGELVAVLSVDAAQSEAEAVATAAFTAATDRLDQ